jgi:hypothetical protein
MGTMRSPRGFAGALVLLVGIAVALGVGMTVGTGAELLVHLTLGATFLLLASATFDFRTPRWVAVIATIAMAAFGLIFLLQAGADITGADWLRQLAFDVLGQQLEKGLGYAFLIWCLGIVIVDSHGWRRALGAVVLGVVAVAEAYGIFLALSGEAAPAAIKLATLPVFVWLALESAQRRWKSPRA